MRRGATRLATGALALVLVGAAMQDAAAFRAFIKALQTRALAAGIAPATFNAATGDLASPDPRIVVRAQRQSEFSQSIGAYVQGAASPDRVAKGRALASRWAPVLDAIERRTGVPREVTLAIWGLESGFGAESGTYPVLQSLATLAFIGPRRDFFTDEFVAALRILEAEPFRAADLKGSWAGAMGQTQFMPSTFLAAAIDQDGDGRRDIWRSVPDSLASIANLLARSGWQAGLPAAFEVVLPAGLDLTVHHRSLAEWSAQQVTRPGGKPLPQAGNASLFLPAGIVGPAFLLTNNFEAVRSYNTSDAYALGVSRLADTLAGGGPLARPWPDTPGLDVAERREVQERLVALGLYAGPPDGRFGAKTRDAVRQFQIARGLAPDGYAGRSVLDSLRQKP
jgi:membrane-bound lytic murein transglycosylase B